MDQNDMMTCHTVYDLTSSGYESYWFPMFGVLPLLACTLLFLARKHFASPGKQNNTSYPSRRPIYVGVLWILMALIVTYVPYRSVLSRYRGGKYEEVSGVIKSLQLADPRRAGAAERFEVDGVLFRLPVYEPTIGFEKTGFLKEGMHVKIRYIARKAPEKATIVRLDIC